MHLRRLLCLSLLAAAALAACGGDDDPAAESTTTTTAPVENPPACAPYFELTDLGEGLNTEVLADYQAASAAITESTAAFVEAAPDDLADDAALMAQGIAEANAEVQAATALKDATDASYRIATEPRYSEASHAVSEWAATTCKR
jgi:hypothetical protein